ncbi:DUF4136 domain-containing protein [Vibrio rotiferianus]|uniref:DUF4136 domain-containing protein n=1 Tax=Vibrio rotiferianus TaxID=190895 RepID=UPI000B59881D|nr:DUF4136 domain-containing protein [Vibrio rotiferianus]ASI96584.1 hypothetical protein BSZ04_16675 [Vibrio rotiferianus]
MIKNMYAIFILITLQSCSHNEQLAQDYKYGVITSGDITQAVQGVKTYSWLSSSNLVHLEGDEASDHNVELIVKRAFETHMSQKGYILQSDNQTADAVFVLGLADQASLSDQAIFEKTRLSLGIDSLGKKGQQKGTVYIALYHPNSKQPIWYAFVQAGIKSNQTKQQQEQRAYRLADSIFSSLPHVPK